MKKKYALKNYKDHIISVCNIKDGWKFVVGDLGLFAATEDYKIGNTSYETKELAMAAARKVVDALTDDEDE